MFLLYFQVIHLDRNSEGKVTIDEFPRNESVFMEEALVRTSKFDFKLTLKLCKLFEIQF